MGIREAKPPFENLTRHGAFDGIML